MRTGFQPAIQRSMATVMLAFLACGAAAAQESQAPPADGIVPVLINSKKNPGDLPYKSAFDTQELLKSYQPAEPRVIDLTLRLAFSDGSEKTQDAYHPETWAVAIVGDTVDQQVPISRGGYFLLPDLEQARKERATIMFNAQTFANRLETAWKLRIAPDNTLSYASFAEALQELRYVQDSIPWYRFGLRRIRNGVYDGLKACFIGPEGRIEIDGQPAATTPDGACQVLPFDADRLRAGPSTIAFVGQLDTVTLHEASQ